VGDKSTFMNPQREKRCVQIWANMIQVKGRSPVRYKKTGGKVGCLILVEGRGGKKRIGKKAGDVP